MKMNKILQLINDDVIAETFFNLKMRYMDERKYENINDYGRVLVNTMLCQGYDVDFQSSKMTASPFGIKVYIDNEKHHIFVKVSGRTWCLCEKKCK